MKRIKIFLSIMFAALPFQVEANKHIENYFTKLYQNEKSEFLECVNEENLDLKEQIKTKCKISTLAKDAAYFLFGTSLSSYDFFDQHTRFKKINEVKLSYPKKAQKTGIEGFTVVKYNISEDGDVLDPKIMESKCGDRRSPFTIFQTCTVFNKESLRIVKEIRYEPAKFEGKKISSDSISHSFTFVMEETGLLIKRQRRAFNDAQKAITQRDFEKAITIAEANLESDYIFMSIIASANYQQGNYLKAKEWSNKLKDELLKEGRKLPESMIVRIYIILVSSLFNLGEYEEITNLEIEFSIYSKARSKYKSILAMTNFYFGVSYINTGNIHKGAYYLGFAAKNSKSKAESDYIDSVIDQISSYL